MGRRSTSVDHVVAQASASTAGSATNAGNVARLDVSPVANSSTNIAITFVGTAFDVVVKLAAIESQP